MKRTEKVAMYSLRYGLKEPIIGFDVFRIGVARESLFVGDGMHRKRILGEGMVECFPGDSVYGRSAWSFDTEKMAMKKFEELVQK